eukprot:8283517-Heterocapsa_arctica.AAC.1
MPTLYQFSDKAASAQQGKFINGLSLGYQNHSTGKLMRGPRKNDLSHAEQTKRTSEHRHNKRKDGSRAHICRIEQNKTTDSAVSYTHLRAHETRSNL